MKENIFLRRRKRRKIFADGKCSLVKKNKNGEGKEGKYLEKETYVYGGEEKQRMKRREIFGEGKSLELRRRRRSKIPAIGRYLIGNNIIRARTSHMTSDTKPLCKHFAKVFYKVKMGNGQT